MADVHQYNEHASVDTRGQNHNQNAINPNIQLLLFSANPLNSRKTEKKISLYTPISFIPPVSNKKIKK